MQHLKIFSLVLFCLIALTTSVQAQEKLEKLFAETTPEQRAKLQTGMMQEKLSLTEDQKTQVYDINLKYAQKLEDAYNAGGSKVKRLRNMKAVSEEKDGQLKTVLTGNQFDLYLKYKDEMREKIKENRKEG
jgi:Spy/CpxP family protein refolding chaperone